MIGRRKSKIIESFQVEKPVGSGYGAFYVREAEAERERVSIERESASLVEQARLDCRFDGPPSDPLVYGDVVVTHPEGSAWPLAEDTDGAAAAGAAVGKHRRYPPWALPGGRLVPFAVETFGRWGSGALEWLRAAVSRFREGE
mgnify:CR=1 FL=1